MNKQRIRPWDELRCELRRRAGNTACVALDAEIAKGNTVAALAMLRRYGIAVSDPG